MSATPAGAIRLLQGALMTAPRTSARRHAVFHRCASPRSTGSPTTASPSPSTCRPSCATNTASSRASTSRSCATSAAAGYAATTRSARPRPVGTAADRREDGCPAARSRPTPRRRLRPGDVLDVMTPTGRFFTRLDPANTQALRRDRGRQRHHAGPVTARHDAAGRAGEPGHPAVRQPDDQLHHVPRGAAGPQGPLPRPVLHLVHFLSREAAGRPTLLSGRIEAGSGSTRLLDLLLPPEDRGRVVPLRAVRHGGAGPAALAGAGVATRGASTPSSSTSGTLPPAAPGGERAAACRPAQHCDRQVLDGRATTCRARPDA